MILLQKVVCRSVVSRLVFDHALHNVILFVAELSDAID